MCIRDRNYVGDVASGSGISVSGTPGEGYTETVALNYGTNLLGWTNLTNYPSTCPAGHAVQIIGDTLTCINISSQGSDTLDGYDSAFFMPLNTSVYGTFDFNGGWASGGLSIDGGDLYAQTIYIYNITSLNVSKQNLTVVDDLIVYGNTELKKNLTVDTDTLFVDSDTDRVGIGTSSPGDDLEIYDESVRIRLRDSGNTSASTTAYVQFGGTDGGVWNRTGYVGDASSPNMDIWLVSSYGMLRLSDSSGEVVTLNSSNVGIGTTSPQNTLNVIGDLNVTTNIYGATLYEEGTSLANKYYGIANPSTFWNDTYATFNETYADTLYVDIDGDTMTGNLAMGENNISANWFKGQYNWTEDSDYLSFDGSTLSFSQSTLNGTIGIYNDSMKTYVDALDTATNTSMKLYVDAQDVVYNTTMSNYVGAVNTTMKTYVDGTFVELAGDTMTGALNLSTINENNYGNLTIDAGTLFVDSVSDRVGIGTTSPQTLFEVSGTGTDARIRITDEDSSGDASYGLLQFVDSGGTTRGLIGDIGTTDDDIYVKASTGELRLFDSSGEVITLNNSNVGIGTTSPNRSLEISHDLEAHTPILRLTGTSASGYAGELEWFSGYDDTITAKMGSTASGTDGGEWWLDVRDQGTDALVRRIYVKNDGSVGINTTTPDYLLDVEGADDIYARIYTTGANSDSGLKIQNDAQEWRIYNWGAVSDVLNFRAETAGNNVLTLQTDSKVGINTTTPQNTLNVVGDLNVTGTIYGAGDANMSDTYVPYTGADKNVVLGANNFSVDSSVLFVDSNSDRVGIGTTNPDYALTLGYEEWIGFEYSNDVTYGAIGTDTAGLSYSIFYDSWGADNEYDDMHVFQTDHDTKMVIENNGDVGIGTTSPTGKLHVNSSGNTDLKIGSGTTGSSSLEFLQDTTRRSIIQHIDTGDNLYLASEYGKMTFATGTGGSEVSRMIIESDGDLAYNISDLFVDVSAGNVGIGTTSPLEPLHIRTASDGNYQIFENANDPVYTRFYSSATNNKNFWISHNYDWEAAAVDYATFGTASILVKADTGNDNRIAFYVGNVNTAPSEKMRIENTGNVGIGTTSPSSKLEINDSTIAQFGLTIKNIPPSTTTTYGLDIQAGLPSSTGPVLRIADKNNTEIMRVQSDGNVGIGTTNPTKELEVVGDINVSSGSTYSILSHNQLGFTGGDGYISTQTAGSDLIFRSNSADEAMRILDSGNVGIGTTEPSTLLNVQIGEDVAGGLNISDPSETIAFLGDSGSTSDRGVLKLYDDTIKVQFAADSALDNYINNGGKVGINTTTPQNTLNVVGDLNVTGTIYGAGDANLSDTYVPYTGADKNVDLGANNFSVDSSVLFVDSNSDMVGIGTTGPDKKLTVDGEISLFSSTGAFATLYGSPLIYSTYNSGGSFPFNTNNNLVIQSRSDTTSNSYGILFATGNPSDVRMFINQAGNVGIGTSSPQTLLHVNGSAVEELMNITNTLSGGDFLIMTDGASGNTVFEFADAGTGGEALLAMYDGGVETIRLRTDDDVWFNNDGNVGIGTASPGGALEVAKGSAHTESILATYSTDNAQIPIFTLFKSNSSTVGTKSQTDDGDELGYVRFQGVDSGSNRDYGAYIRAIQNGVVDTRVPTDLAFGTATATAIAERMRIDSSGNVGIGTTSPGEQLEISGDVGDATIRIRQTRYAPTAHYFDIAYIDSGGLYFSDAAGDKNVQFSTNGGVAVGSGYATGAYNLPDNGMLIQGNVGIGTTAPGAKLDVGTSAQTSAGISARGPTGGNSNNFEWGHTNSAGYGSTIGYLISSGNPYIAFNGEAGTLINTFKTRGIRSSIILSDITGGMQFGNVATASADNQTFASLVTIANTGNVGIGTTGPGAKLDVEVGSVTTGLTVRDASDRRIELITPGVSTYGTIQTNGTSNGLLLKARSGGNQLFLKDDGNVGIGDTGPEGKLEVAGDIEIEYLEDRDGTNFFDNTCTYGVASIDNTGALSCASQQGTGDGTVTSVAAGDGMDFTTITTSGSVTMGTPSTLTSATTNALTSTSHTHAITNYALSGTSNQVVVTGAAKVLGAAATLSLPQDIHTAANPTFGTLTLTTLKTTNLQDSDASNFFDGGCSADQYISGIDATGAITCAGDSGTGTMSSFILGASSGTNQTITQGNTAFIAAGTGITTTGAATDKVTVAATLGTAISIGEIDFDHDDLGGLGDDDHPQYLALAQDETMTGKFSSTDLSSSTVASGAPVYINPASATADYALLGLAVGGVQKFEVDEDGDIDAAGSIDIDGGSITDGGAAWLEVSSCGANTGVSSVSAAGTITCTADDNDDNYGSWTIAGDDDSSTVSSGQTATIAGSGTIDTAQNARTVTVSVQADSIDDAQIVNDGIEAGSIAADAITNSELGANSVDLTSQALSTAYVGTGILGGGASALGFDCSEVEGTGINCAGEAITLDATGDWTGTLDSLNAADFLRSNADDSLTAAIVVPTANRDEGIFGTYDSTKTQHVWSMGTSYRNNATGYNFGNLYGLAYKYNGDAGGHGIYLVQNGVATVGLGDSLWTSGNVLMTDDDYIGISGAERIQFDTGGEIEIMGAEVGIGTTTPSYPLHVSGKIYSTTALQGGSAVAQTSGSYAAFGSNSASVPISLTIDTDPTNGKGIVIATDGRVGIGTDTPYADLYIKDGTDGATALHGDYITMVRSNLGANLGLTTHDDGITYSYIRLQKSDSDSLGVFLETDSGDILGVIDFQGQAPLASFAGTRIKAVQDGAATEDYFHPATMIFQTGDGSALLTNDEHLVLDGPTGNVGIGTATPLATLHVTGSIVNNGWTTFADGDTTPSVAGNNIFYMDNTGDTTITDFDDAVDGQMITIYFTDTESNTITRNNAYLAGGNSFVSTQFDIITLIYRGATTYWYEVSRSVNS